MQVTVAKFESYPQLSPTSRAVGFTVTFDNGRSVYIDTIVSLDLTDDVALKAAWENIKGQVENYKSTIGATAPILGSFFAPNPVDPTPKDEFERYLKDLAAVRDAALQAEEARHRTVIDAGFQMPDRNYKIAIDVPDSTEFLKAIIAANAGLEAGYIQPTDTRAIKDISPLEELHEETYAYFLNTILGPYALAYEQIWATNKMNKTAILRKFNDDRLVLAREYNVPIAFEYDRANYEDGDLVTFNELVYVHTEVESVAGKVPGVDTDYWMLYEEEITEEDVIEDDDDPIIEE